MSRRSASVRSSVIGAARPLPLALPAPAACVAPAPHEPAWTETPVGVGEGVVAQIESTWKMAGGTDNLFVRARSARGSKGESSKGNEGFVLSSCPYGPGQRVVRATRRGCLCPHHRRYRRRRLAGVRQFRTPPAGREGGQRPGNLFPAFFRDFRTIDSNASRLESNAV